MRDAMAEKICHFCGSRIVSGVRARDNGDHYCCEGCYLKEREFTALRDTAQRAMQTLAEALVAALDAREHETGLHSRRVACHTLVLARRFTEDDDELRQIYWGALLHDIGKIGIPDAILLKHGSLTDDEWAVMRTHPEKGHAILQGVPFLREAAGIVLTHEERYDGTGYPQGLRGEAIPWGARLFAVIDALDAITTDRPYRPAQSFDAARAEILRATGAQFDPKACEAFDAEQKVLREMVALKCGAAALPATLANMMSGEKEGIMAIDPVCGMTVDEKKAAAKADYQDKTYYFCSTHCHNAFTAAPAKYSKAGSTTGSRHSGGGTHHHG